MAFTYSGNKSVLLEDLTMYQAALLLLVGERSSVSVATCLKQLELKKAEFELEMSELFSSSPPILIRPNPDTLSESDRLSANTSFTYDKSFLKLNQYKQRDVTANSTESDERLYQEKKSVWESVTVRILKEQKKKLHQELFDLVSKRLSHELSVRTLLTIGPRLQKDHPVLDKVRLPQTRREQSKPVPLHPLTILCGS